MRKRKTLLECIVEPDYPISVAHLLRTQTLLSNCEAFVTLANIEYSPRATIPQRHCPQSLEMGELYLRYQLSFWRKDVFETDIFHINMGFLPF
jgi:hypothetical protein